MLKVVKLLFYCEVTGIGKCDDWKANLILIIAGGIKNWYKFHNSCYIFIDFNGYYQLCYTSIKYWNRKTYTFIFDFLIIPKRLLKIEWNNLQGSGSNETTQTKGNELLICVFGWSGNNLKINILQIIEVIPLHGDTYSEKK